MTDDGDDVLPAPKPKGPSVKQLRELGAQNQWLQAHIDWSALRALAYDRTNDPMTAIEVVRAVHHTMLQWPLEELNKLRTPQAYAATAVINGSKNSKRWFKRVVLGPDPYAGLASDAPTPERQLESRDEVLWLLSRLPEEWRGSFALTEYLGFTIEETAEYLGLSVDAVKRRKVDALKYLRIVLELIPPDSIVSRVKKLFQRKEHKNGN